MELKKWMKTGGCWKRKAEEDKAEEFKVWEKKNASDKKKAYHANENWNVLIIWIN